jgi:DNA-binding NtrC family response regulator
MRKIKILILDDDDELRYNLSLFLEDEGYDTAQFSNCDDALNNLQSDKFLVAIVDIRLPGMSGDEFVPLASKIDPKLKFIIHTGSNDFDLSSELIRCGLREEDVFRKPVIDMAQFSIKINELIQR